MDAWYILRGGVRYGPFAHAQFQRMTETGQLLPVDLVAQGENGSWVPASQVAGLFNSPPSPPTAEATSSFDFGTPAGPEHDQPAPGGERRQDPSSRPGSNRVLLFAVAGVLVVALVGVAIFLLARDGTKGTAPTDPASKGQQSDGKGKARSGNRRPGKTYLEDVIAEKGSPLGSYAEAKKTSDVADYCLHVWKSGTGYDLVYTAIPTKIPEPEFVQNTIRNVDQVRLDAILKGYRRK